MITIDPEDARLSKRERDFLRTIALKLQADAQRRWAGFARGFWGRDHRSVRCLRQAEKIRTKSAFLIARSRGAKKAG